MMLSLLIGNILLIGIVSSAPLYVRATLQRILIKDLQQYQVNENKYPATIEITYSFNAVRDDLRMGGYAEVRDDIIPDALESFGVPATMIIPFYTMDSWSCRPVVPREENPRTKTLNLMAF